MGVDVNQQSSGGFFSMLSSVIKNESSQPRTATPLPNLSNNANSGDFFIRMSIDLLQNSREYKRNEHFRAAITKALEALDKMETNQIIIFKPFQLACQSGTPETITIAIDCLGKLFTYNYWKFAQDVQLESNPKKENGEDGDNDGTSAMIAFVIDTICDAFSGENTDEKVQLQIIKALQAAVTNVDPAFSLHGAVLLKAIRTTYNVFLLSKSHDVQIVAQGTVTQMIQNVFGRIPNPNQKTEKKLKREESKKLMSESSDSSSSTGQLEEKKADIPATKEEKDGTEYARELKDAFKVFRTLCILGIKPIPTPEGTIDLRSQPIRSKLLALHLVTAVLQSHMYVFPLLAKPVWELVKDPLGTIENFRFIDAVKEFLILNLSRNATSIVLPIFEISLELFGKVWTGLRSYLKKEIAVFFTEIVIPILEAKKNIAWYQRYALLKALIKIFSEPQGGQMLVEIYLNYDCDVEATAKENIWERLMNAVAKITSLHVDPNATPAPLINSFVHSSPSPALTTSNLVLLTREQVRDLFAPTGDQMELRKQGVKLMSSGILRPLLEWLTQRADEIKEEQRAESDGTENTKSLGLVAEEESVSPAKAVPEDDPQAILQLKQRKQNMIEGVKKFNQKPKKGIQFLLDTKCISSRTPRDIAKFLMTAEGLNKTQIGDFLGEG
jgi:brefeldin A-inhibited guanine nucleotide-exchange protein